MEDDLFLKKMKGVKPIKRKDEIKRTIKNTKTLSPTNKTKENKKEEILKKNKKTINTKHEYKLSFGEINKSLKRGKIKVDRKVDLHGFSLFDAQIKFKDEVLKCYNLNKRCLLIITGKGLYKKKDEKNHLYQTSPKLYYGKIKNSIMSWIEETDIKRYILTYQDAGIEYGGDGAIFVYLRKNKAIFS